MAPARFEDVPASLQESDLCAACVPSGQDYSEEHSPLPSYPLDDLLDNISLVSAPTTKDPFSGTDPSGFSLSAMSAAVGGRRVSSSPESKEEALWRIVRAGEGSHPQKVVKDRVEKIYRQDHSMFMPPLMAVGHSRSSQGG